MYEEYYIIDLVVYQSAATECEDTLCQWQLRYVKSLWNVGSQNRINRRVGDMHKSDVMQCHYICSKDVRIAFITTTKHWLLCYYSILGKL
jgi:hypothetical protein